VGPVAPPPGTVIVTALPIAVTATPLPAKLKLDTAFVTTTLLSATGILAVPPPEVTGTPPGVVPSL
jgi:hypothetical protein